MINMRRLRFNPAVRSLVQEYSLDSSKMILPLFVREGTGIKQEIGSMPGQFQMSLDVFKEKIRQLSDLNIGGVILFGIPDVKDEVGSDAMSDSGIIPRAIEAAKSVNDKMLIVTDVCFCEYTSHGHCGCIGDVGGRKEVDNDKTLDMIARQTLAHARAGADMVAPSGMMDGMIGTMRTALDASGFAHLPIMSYSAKYASAFYGPFREAAESAPKFGDRRSYQMDIKAGIGQAMREIQLDIDEGADIVMVKPALAYLDVIRLAKERFPDLPLAAYNVSGEYSMVKAAAQLGWIDERRIVEESLIAIARAGASIVITYWAEDVAQWEK